MKFMLIIVFASISTLCQSQLIEKDSLIVSKTHPVSIHTSDKDFYKLNYSIITKKNNYQEVEISFKEIKENNLQIIQFDSLLLRHASGKSLVLRPVQDTVFLISDGKYSSIKRFGSATGVLDIFQSESIFEVVLAYKQKVIIFKFKEN